DAVTAAGDDGAGVRHLSVSWCDRYVLAAHPAVVFWDSVFHLSDAAVLPGNSIRPGGGGSHGWLPRMDDLLQDHPAAERAGYCHGGAVCFCVGVDGFYESVDLSAKP